MDSILLLVAKLIDLAVTVYIFIMFARAIISWVQPNPYNPIVVALYRLTEPVLQPVRRVLFKSIGRNVGIDFSPLVVIVLLFIFRKFVLTILLY
jgi:YggT family protein